MIGQVDLHLHSTASDGQYTPAELVQLATQKNLRAIALTDHDTTDGVGEALRAAHGTGLLVIPGVEISTDVPGEYEVHILGYGVDHGHGPCGSKHPMQERLRVMRGSRLDRARKMWERLGQLGRPVSWERVLALAGGGSVGRPHIAQALVEAGHAESVQDAFQRYVGLGAAAYIPRPKLSPEQAVQLILSAGGVPVLAHPIKVIEYIPALVRSGLAGLEVYYNRYSEVEQQFLAGLAHKHNLILTGGSDFHGPQVLDTVGIGEVSVPWSVVEQLQAALSRIK